MRRLIAPLIALTLMAAACTAAPEDPATSTTSASTTTSTSTTSTSTPTSTSTSSTSTTTAEPVPAAATDLPVTFVGVTEDREAVEVETATGTVLRTPGRMTTVEELAAQPDEEQGFATTIDNVWRTRDGSWYVISECCEPAAGILHRLETAQVVLVEDDGAGGRSSVPLEWATDEGYVSGLARHYSGQLLAVQHDDGVGSGTTQLIVFEPDGSLVARYGFGTGELGGYDAAARYLIYVDGDGVVRWRGEGRTGVLAEGFVAASW